MVNRKFVWQTGIAAALAIVLLAPSAYAADADMIYFPAPPPASRPVALLPLYVSFGALQALDAASTLHNVAGGATEANPVMSGVVGSPGAFVATKGALAVASIYCTEKLWKKNRAAAIGVMIALNGVSATIVARNYATRTGR